MWELGSPDPGVPPKPGRMLLVTTSVDFQSIPAEMNTIS